MLEVPPGAFVYFIKRPRRDSLIYLLMPSGV
jgi:hypothetical protein